ncbi:hypothetical protein ACRRTK_011514 [Alexandromys fortis]
MVRHSTARGPSRESRPLFGGGATGSYGRRVGATRVGPAGDGQRAPRARAAWEGWGRREAGGGAERVGPGSGCRDAASPGTRGWRPLPSSQPGTLVP